MKEKMNLDSLRRALPMLTLCEREGMVFRQSAGNSVAPCPFHEDRTPSFTIHAASPGSAHCYGCGWNGDIFTFWSKKRGISPAGQGFREIVSQLASLCGIAPPRPDVQFPAKPPKCKIPLSILDEKPPRLPELVQFTTKQAKTLATLRGYDLEGLREARRRGYLHFCYWPVDRDGQPDGRTAASWCITDRARRTAQFRLMSGGLYGAGHGKEGIKAWSTKGVRWLVGCEDVTPETSLVLLVEGGADFLATWSLIARQDTVTNNISVCCMFGGTVHIAPGCRAMMRGKHVRIVMDVDPPKILKKGKKEIEARAGTEAAERWSRELEDAGATVDVYSLEGLVCLKNGGERPVGDLNDLLLMTDPDRMDAVARQLLSTDAAIRLPGETTLRVGKVHRPAAGSAAVFIPAGIGAPEPAPRLLEAETAAPEPQLTEEVPDFARLLQAGKERELEDAKRKLTAGARLTPKEEKLIAKAFPETIAIPPDSEMIATICGEIDAWWVNGGGSTFLVKNGGSQWLEVPQETLITMLLMKGIIPAKIGGPVEQHRECLLHIMQKRNVDRAIEGLAGFRPGIHEFKGFTCLIRKGPSLIEPKEGTWELIENLLMGLLGLDDVPGARGMVQYERFLYWLARAARNVHRPVKSNLNSHIMMLAGPAGSGKSLIQHQIITPVLGGRSGNPSKYVFGKTDFNEGWLACEHLLIEDPEPHPKMQDRLMLAQILKGLCVNDDHTLHPKGKSELGVPARFVVSLSINDDPDAMRILPKMTPDFAEKVQLLKVRKIPDSLLPQEDEEKEIFKASIRAEIPAFLHYLLQLEVPEKLKERRFGVQHYLNFELVQRMGDDTPEGEFLQLLDHCLIRGRDSGVDKPLWETPLGYSAAEFLEANPQTTLRSVLEECVMSKKRVWIGSALSLLDTMENCINLRAWKKIADHNSIPRLLVRLAADRPERVQAFGSNKIRHGWIIVAPEPDENADHVTDTF